MTPLRALLPGIQASGSRCAARHLVGDRRTVLGVKGALRRRIHRGALDSSAPFCSVRISRRAAPPGTRGRAVSSSYDEENRWQ